MTTTTSSIAGDTCFSIGAGAAIPARDLAPWAVLAVLIATVFVYFVGAEQGAFAIFDGMYVHEYVHDGRHLLGFPCH
ncbi:CbtB domain-containing protein [Sphingomonas adhaesiva]|uniref:CbtB domain-containing protein n=1 Tax=Sphingomonas adhaesiva TaxID=28212 RepID=UPI002FFA2335